MIHKLNGAYIPIEIDIEQHIGNRSIISLVSAEYNNLPENVKIEPF